MLIIHSLGPDNTYRSLHAFAQFISCGNNATVFHILHRSLIADVHLDACALFPRESLRHQLCQLLLLLERADDLLCALFIGKLRVFENVRRAARVYMHILVDLDGVRHRVQYIPYHFAVYPGLFLEPCDKP